MSLLGNPGDEELGKKPEVAAASLLGMRLKVVLSFSGTAVGDDSEVLLLSLSGNTGRVVDIA